MSSTKLCTCGSARTHRRWKIKSASFGKSPGGVVGTSWRSTATQASPAPRDETDGLASIPCSRTPPGGSSTSSWHGRLTAWAAERLTRYNPTPRSMRRGLVPGPAGHRHDDPDGQARFPANRRICGVRADDDPPTDRSRSQARRRPRREARQAEGRQCDRTECAKAACEGRGYFEGGKVARYRDRDSAAH